MAFPYKAILFCVLATRCFFANSNKVSQSSSLHPSTVDATQKRYPILMYVTLTSLMRRMIHMMLNEPHMRYLKPHHRDNTASSGAYLRLLAPLTT